MIVDRQGSRRQARARRIRTRCHRRSGGAAGVRKRSLSHHAQRAWRRFPDGAPPPVGALAAAGGHPARAGRDHQGGARFLRRARIHPDRSADPYAGRLRRHHAPCFRSITSTSRHTSRSRASSTSKPRRWRWARCIRFGPTFRAEKSKTRRHLTEFWMVEPEVAYAELDDLMELAEGFISFIVKRCLEKRRADLQTIGRDIAKLEKIEPPFPRISYDDAVTDVAGSATPRALLENEVRMGRRLGLAGRNLHFVAVRQAGDGASLSGEGEGVLHGARSAAAGTGAVRGRPRAGRLRRNHRRLAAHGVVRTAAASAFTNTACRKRLSSGISTCASLAACRTAASAWASNARWRGSAVWSTCARQFRFARMLHRLYP